MIDYKQKLIKKEKKKRKPRQVKRNVVKKKWYRRTVA